MMLRIQCNCGRQHNLLVDSNERVSTADDSQTKLETFEPTAESSSALDASEIGQAE